MFSSFSTDQWVESERLERWNRFQRGYFPGMAFQGKRDLNARWQSCSLDGLLVGLVNSEDALVERRIRSAGSPDDSVLVHLTLEGRCSTVQAGGVAICGPGTMTICSGTRSYDLEISGPFQAIVIECDRREIGCQASDLGKCWEETVPVLGVLRDFVMSLHAQHWTIDVTALERLTFKTILTGLLRRCLDMPGRSSHDPDGRLFRSIASYVDAHLQDGGIGTGRIAHDLAISPRTVQLVFAHQATTLRQYILDQRLSYAEARLRDGAGRGDITGIAHDLGFADAAHFIRRFKQRHGVSPLRFVADQSVARSAAQIAHSTNLAVPSVQSSPEMACHRALIREPGSNRKSGAERKQRLV